MPAITNSVFQYAILIVIATGVVTGGGVLMVLELHSKQVAKRQEYIAYCLIAIAVGLWLTVYSTLNMRTAIYTLCT
jgi:hypothetical protein